MSNFEINFWPLIIIESFDNAFMILLLGLFKIGCVIEKSSIGPVICIVLGIWSLEFNTSITWRTDDNTKTNIT
tara:strand:- start:10688 stop:10906 length:219 start_codon:yes stop_codon:yes gene_type:complete